MRNKNISAYWVALVVILFSSCDEDELLPPVSTNAYFSFINASPYLGNDGRGNATAIQGEMEINGVADTSKLFITYRNIYPAPNKYLPYPEGSNKVIFKDSTQKLLSTGNVSTSAGKYYSAILADSMEHYSTILVEDDYEPVAGKALVRIMHFSPDAGEIVLFRDTVEQETFGVMRFKQVTAYTPVEPGSNFSFILRRNDGSHQRVGRYFASSLAAGAAYTILLKGYVSPPDGDMANKSSQMVFFRN